MNDGAFITASLPFAAYLVASGNLQLREVRLTDGRRAVLVFDDHQGRGAELQRKFEAGAAVSALAFHMQLRILRRAIDNEIQAANLGATRPNNRIQGKHHDLSIADQR